MRFLADECVEVPIVERLRDDGHEVLYVAEMTPGITDDEVLALANSNTMLLMTEDKDFGELVYRMQRVAEGVVLMRFAGLASSTKAALVSKAVREHEAELIGSFTVIDASSVRIRRRFG
jgi:predicted nuclease of predicted toxin-antitoxin system